jgi:aminopeptidase N
MEGTPARCGGRQPRGVNLSRRRWLGATAALAGCGPLVRQPETPPAVTHYALTLAPELAGATLEGRLALTLHRPLRAGEPLELQAGGLEVLDASCAGRPLAVERQGRTLRLTPGRDGTPADTPLMLAYRGSPTGGLFFTPAFAQMHTVFSTAEWMPCQDAPSQRATFSLELLLPRPKRVAASGDFLGEGRHADGRFVSRWQSRRPLPAYLFGFACGPFNEVVDTHGRVTLRHLATPSFNAGELRQVFRDTGSLLAFCERMAGVPYPGAAYTQVVLAGRAAQELGDLSLLGERYARGVLRDPGAQWLGAHELAHTWWGNGVTNADWGHFWLNEGLASFMAAACLGDRFGPAAYERAIDASRQAYERLRRAGKDRPLVFADWSAPTDDDRSIVYDKGAWVMHLLRERMGPVRFETGLRDYTRRHWGRAVTTPDLLQAMQAASDHDLQPFFDEWVWRR